MVHVKIFFLRFWSLSPSASVGAITIYATKAVSVDEGVIMAAWERMIYARPQQCSRLFACPGNTLHAGHHSFVVTLCRHTPNPEGHRTIAMRQASPCVQRHARSCHPLRSPHSHVLTRTSSTAHVLLGRTPQYSTGISCMARRGQEYLSDYEHALLHHVYRAKEGPPHCHTERRHGSARRYARL